MATTKLNMTKGLIPRPTMLSRIATKKIENVGMNRIGKRVLRGICWHRGITGNQTFEGAVEYLTRASTAGLTDGYIDHRTGAMARMTPEWGRADDMTPWAQGPYNPAVASQDALDFVAKYMPLSGGKGYSVWNSDLFSIEVTGDYGTPISAETKRTMIQIQASISHDAEATHATFPLANGVSTMFGHREGCGTAYKLCPGDVVWTYINSAEFINAVKAVMKQFELGAEVVEIIVPPVKTTPVEQYAPLLRPAFLEEEGKPFVDDDGTRFILVTDQVRAIRPTPRLQLASPKAKRVGPDMKIGEDASVSFIFTAKEDGEMYYLSNYGTRFLAKDFERVSDQPAKA